MNQEFIFFLQILVSGLLSGLMYSLVAIGFVLIYKASGVFNFAQGSMVLSAGLTFVGFLEMNLFEGATNFYICIGIAAVVMVVVGVVVERVALRHLVNTSLLTLFMATVGLSYIFEGMSQYVWGGEVHELPLERHTGIVDIPLNVPILEGFTVSQFDLFGAGIAGTLVLILALFFQKTRTGMFLRAVADNHMAAISVGIPLNRMWAIVWATAGIISLVAGIMWGARLGVQFTLSVVAMKAVPVFIVGGFTSITGAIVAGLIVGASENLGEIYITELTGTGGGVQNWAPYMVALIIILIRPSGLFGQKSIERI